MFSLLTEIAFSRSLYLSDITRLENHLSLFLSHVSTLEKVKIEHFIFIFHQGNISFSFSFFSSNCCCAHSVLSAPHAQLKKTSTLEISFTSQFPFSLPLPACPSSLPFRSLLPFPVPIAFPSRERERDETRDRERDETRDSEWSNSSHPRPSPVSDGVDLRVHDFRLRGCARRRPVSDCFPVPIFSLSFEL